MGSFEHSERHRGRTGEPERLSAHVGWPIWCWLFVLIAIGIVQIVRMQWFDTAVFFTAAAGAGLAATQARAPAVQAARASGQPLSLLVLSSVAAILGAVLCFVPRHGVVMQVATVAIGVAVAWLALGGRAVSRPDRQTGFGPGIRRLTLAWAVVVVIGCVWELVQFILGLVQPDAAWFSLSDLLNPLAGTVPGKIVIVVAWLAGGVWLLRRGGRR